MRGLILIGILMLFSASIVSANPYSFNLYDLPTFNNNTAYVNASANWVTLSLGALSDAQDGQFNNVGGALTIDSSYLDANWCALTGCTMAGDFNTGGNNIILGGGDISGVNNVTANNFNGGNGSFDNIYVTNNITAGDTLFGDWNGGNVDNNMDVLGNGAIIEMTTNSPGGGWFVLTDLFNDWANARFQTSSARWQFGLLGNDNFVINDFEHYPTTYTPFKIIKNGEGDYLIDLDSYPLNAGNITAGDTLFGDWNGGQIDGLVTFIGQTPSDPALFFQGFNNGVAEISTASGADRILSIHGSTKRLDVNISGHLNVSDNITAGDTLFGDWNGGNVDNDVDINGDIYANKYFGVINVNDTRATVPYPNDYNKEVSWEFKSSDDINLTSSNFLTDSNWLGLQTIAPWGDDSGGRSHQVAYTNIYGVFYRHGLPDSENSWDDNDEWRRIIMSDLNSENITTTGNITANTLFGDWNGGNVDGDVIIGGGGSSSLLIKRLDNTKYGELKFATAGSNEYQIGQRAGDNDLHFYGGGADQMILTNNELNLQDNNLTTTGNITADYIFANVSLADGLPVSLWTNESGVATYNGSANITEDLSFANARTTGSYQAKITNPTSLINVDGLNTDPIIYVVSTDGFSDEGYLAIYNSIIKYTGKTATSFTGCSISELGPNTVRAIGPSTGGVWDNIHQSENFLIDLDGSFATYGNTFHIFRDANNYIKATGLVGKTIFQNSLMYNEGVRGNGEHLRLSTSKTQGEIQFYGGQSTYEAHYVFSNTSAVAPSPLPHTRYLPPKIVSLIDMYFYGDGLKILFGGAGDVSMNFNGTDMVEKVEIGSTVKRYFEGFAEYVFDNDVLVDGNLNVMGNFSIKNPYGSWSSNESQVVAVADVVQVMNFSHEEDTYLMGIEGNENITVHKSGDYLITLSVVVVTDSSNKHFDVWPQTTHADGVTMANVPRSNTQIFIENAGTEQIISVSFILDLHEMDKFRIMYGSDDADSMTVWHDGHGTGVNAVPETPSIIMTVTKISEITD